MAPSLNLYGKQLGFTHIFFMWTYGRICPGVGIDRTLVNIQLILHQRMTSEFPGLSKREISQPAMGSHCRSIVGRTEQRGFRNNDIVIAETRSDGSSF